jgi:hypothetical protein
MSISKVVPLAKTYHQYFYPNVLSWEGPLLTKSNLNLFLDFEFIETSWAPASQPLLPPCRLLSLPTASIVQSASPVGPHCPTHSALCGHAASATQYRWRRPTTPLLSFSASFFSRARHPRHGRPISWVPSLIAHFTAPRCSTMRRLHLCFAVVPLPLPRGHKHQESAARVELHITAASASVTSCLKI